MVNFAVGLLFGAMQLIGPGGALPQVVEADYSSTALAPGGVGQVIVQLNVRDGYLINHTPPMQLKLRSVPGLTLAETDFVSDPIDPDSADVYYVNVPNFTVSVSAERPGAYEVPGELVYFFCSKADGFCARQTLDVSLPVVAE